MHGHLLLYWESNYNTLQRIKDDDFEHLWENREFDNGFEPGTKEQKNDEDSCLRYYQLYHAFLDSLMANIKLRFYS